MEPILQAGRPEPQGRSETELRVYDLLDSLGIGYGRVDHAAAATIEDCLEVEKILGTEICKNLFLTNSQKSAFYLLMMPGSKAFKTKDLSKQIGSSRLSFADAENMVRLLGLTPGAVSIMGLMNDTSHGVKLLIDRDVLRHEYLGCHPCVNTSSLRIKTQDVLETFLPHTGHELTIVDL